MTWPDDIPDLKTLVAQALVRRIAVKTAPESNRWKLDIGPDRWPMGKGQRWPVKLAGLAQVGDELWWHCSPAETWKYLCGVAGWALVREGKLVEYTVELEN